MKKIGKKSSALLLSLLMTTTNVIPYTSFASEKSDGEKTESFPILEHYLKSKVKEEVKEKKNNQKLRLIVELDENKENQATLEILSIPGVKLHYKYNELLNGISIDIPSESVSRLNSIDGVLKIKKSEKLVPQMFNSKEITKVVQAKAKYSNKYGLDGRGMLIATIDSGVDIHHPDMRIDDDAIKDMKIKDIKPPFTNKVPFGYNYFKSEKENLKGIDGNPHGMHIAGILAGNSPDKDGFKGVAPNAQLLVYKVITYDRKGKDADPYEIEYIGEDAQYHAMEDAVSKGADIISLSIGDFGSGRSDDVWESVIQKCHEKGVVVVAAMGNRAASNSESSYDSVADVAFERNDTAAIVSVAANRNVIGAGSTKNTQMRLPSVRIGDMNFAYSNLSRYNDSIAPNKREKNLPSEVFDGEFVFAKRGRNEENLNKEEVKGKIVVLLRGGEALKEKANRFLEKGAKGIIILNYLSDYSRGEYKEQPIVGSEHLSIDKGWVVSLSYNDGLKLLDEAKKKGSMSIKFDPTLKQTTIASESLISGFSSWGPNYDLEMKPDIVAPGENIYSTGNGGTYKIMSGTSMSSPNIAGISTLLLSKTRKINDDNVKKINVSDLTRIMMMNTANVLNDYEMEGEKILPYSPRRQGAGQIDLDKALGTDVIVTYNGSKGAASLKEIGDNERFNLTLTNFSDNVRSFDVETLDVMTQKTSKRHIKDDYQEINSGTAHETVVDGAKIEGPSEVVIQPHSTTTIRFDLDTGKSSNQFIEGYIKFVSKDEEQPNLSMPYMGFKGSWGEENILDKPQWEEGSITKLARLQKYLKYEDHSGEFTFEQLGKKDSNGIDDPSTYFINSTRGGKPNYYTEVKKVAPSLVFLRETNQYDVSIVDKKEVDAKPLRVINKGYYPEKYMENSFKEFDESYQNIFRNIDPNAIWDGGIYNPKQNGGGWESNWFKAAPEGQYYYRIRAKKNDKDPWDVIYMPIKVDNTRPFMKTTYDKDKKVANVHLHDNSGIEYAGATINGKLVHMKDNGDNNYEIAIPEDEVSKQTLRIEAMDFAGNPVSNEVNLGEKELSNVDENNLVLDKDGESIEKDKDSHANSSQPSHGNEDYDEDSEKFDPRSISIVNGHFVNYGIFLKHRLIEDERNPEDVKYEVSMDLSGNQRAVVTNTNTHWNWKNKEKDQFKVHDTLELTPDDSEQYISIKEGDNYIKVRVYEGEKVVYDHKFTVYLDINAPTVEFGNNVSLDAPEDDEGYGTSTTTNGKIYSKSKNAKIQGVVQDNLDKYVVRVNGDVVKRYGLKGHFGPEYNKSSFEYDYDAREGDYVHVVLEDSSGNARTFELEAIIDDEAPAITVNNEESLDSESTLDFEVTDNVEDDNKDRSVTYIASVNGKEYKPDTELSEYDVEGKEGSYNIEIVAVDLAGNVNTYKKIIEKKSGDISKDIVTPELKKKSYAKEEIGSVEKLFNLEDGITAKILKTYDETKHQIKMNVEFVNEFGIKTEKEYIINLIDSSENMELDESLNRELKKSEFNVGELSKFSQLFDLSDSANAILKEKIDVSKPGKRTFNVKFTKNNKYFEREYTLNIVGKDSDVKPEPMPKPDPSPTPQPKPDVKPTPNTGGGAGSSGGGSLISPSNDKVETNEKDTSDDGVISKFIKSLGIKQERVWGKTRIQTAVEISKKSFDKADSVILVSDKSNADSLTSSLFAKEKNAPILLTNNKSLSIDVENEINRLNAKDIYIVGGERSVSKDVYRTLIEKGFNVKRISGKDRYETSAKLLGMVNTNKNNIFVVNGNSETDAISISPVSAISKTPILLVNGKKVDAKAINILNSYKNKTVIGGISSVSNNYQNSIGADRISGVDRFDTSMKIKNKFLKDSKEIVISSGKVYVDALVGSVYAAKNNSPILLIDSDNISKDIKDSIKSSQKVTILGGINSIK